jgi:ATP synthase delta (OSCP) subunit
VEPKVPQTVATQPAPAAAPLKLPMGLISRVDIARLLRELNTLEDFFIAANNRPSGTSIEPPRVTRLLGSLAEENRCNLLDGNTRKSLTAQLTAVRDKAPEVHISFASEPSPKALERLIAWFRTSVHPQLLLQVGLQPSIATGCVLRTPNKFFDMSLRAYLIKQEEYLVQLIKGATG